MNFLFILIQSLIKLTMKNDILKAISTFTLNTSRRTSDIAEEGSVLSIKNIKATPIRARQTQRKGYKENQFEKTRCYSKCDPKGVNTSKRESLRYNGTINTERKKSVQSACLKNTPNTAFGKYNFDKLERSDTNESKGNKSIMSSKSIVEFNPTTDGDCAFKHSSSKKSANSSTKTSITNSTGSQLMELQTQIGMIKNYVFHVLRPKPNIDKKPMTKVEGLYNKLSKMEEYFKISQKIAGDLAFVYKNSLDDIKLLKKEISESSRGKLMP